MSDSETWRASLGVFAICAVLNGRAALAPENDERPLTLRRAVELSMEHRSELALATTSQQAQLELFKATRQLGRLFP